MIGRVREVAALLTLARSFGTLAVDGIWDMALVASSAAIGVYPMLWLEADGGALQAKHKIVAPRWARDPDRLTTDDLARSWAGEHFLTAAGGRRWAVPASVPLFALLGRRSRRTPVQQTAVRAALHLYQAHAANEASGRLIQAVTSLEMLFPGTTHYEQLMRRVAVLAPVTEESREHTDRIFRARHSFVHAGEPVPDGLADLALGFSALVIACFVEASSLLERNAEDLARYLDLVEAIRRAAPADVKDDVLAHLPVPVPATNQWFIATKLPAGTGPGAEGGRGDPGREPVGGAG